MESKILIRAKSHVKSKLKETLLSRNLHYLVANHNKIQSNSDLKLEFEALSLSEMFQEYPYNCDFPKPLLPPAKMQRDCCGREDTTMQLIYTKAKIQDDINRYLGLYKKYSSTLDKYKNRDIQWIKENKTEHATLPKYVAVTAEILEHDPDPNFTGSYNWYYTGGTLNGISCDSRNLLIFPFSNELVLLPVDLKENSLLTPNYKNATKIPLKDNVFQVVCSVSNNNERILTRQKNTCILYNIFNLNKEKLDILEIDKQSSDSSYISADLHPTNVNNYCTTNLDRKLQIWDIMKSKYLLSESIPVKNSLQDNWSIIKYGKYDNDILKYTDRNCVRYYDTRLTIKQSVLTMCPKDNLENCESLCSFIDSSKGNYYSYIGSNHSLCLLDSRSPNNAVVKKWTHQFKSSPLFMDVSLRDNKEFVIIGSQLAGETAIILNSWNLDVELPESYGTPFSPTSMVEALTILQSQGSSLSPYIRNRLLLCNTGCMTTVDQRSSEVFLLTQNSLNDIFYQGIGHEEPLNALSFQNCKSLDKLRIWERQIWKTSHRNITSPLVVTKVADASNFMNAFNQRLRSGIKNKDSDELDYFPSWKRSIEELNSFVDILAPELLAPWEMLEEPPVISTTASHDKVRSWLEMGGDDDDNQSQRKIENIIDSQQTSEMRIKETIFNLDANLFAVENNESNQQFSLPRVKSKIKSSNSQSKKDKDSKRTNFVPGF